MRQIVLDTETTGLETEQGHRIIEIGAIELVDRQITDRQFHQYLNPQRAIDEAAVEIHGITLDQLKDKPTFAEVVQQLLDFIKEAELIIHNAPFDIGFLNYELKEAGRGGDLIDQDQVLDTLVLARHKHPGQRNSLDALCKRYNVDNTQRTFHGALLDAEILAEVYLLMTGGQTTLLAESDDFMQASAQHNPSAKRRTQKRNTPLVLAKEQELVEHQKWLALLRNESNGEVVWDQLETEATS